MNDMLIDGKGIAEKMRIELKKRATEFTKKHGRKCGLAVILVGNNSASDIYVNNKSRDCTEVGIECTVHRLPENTNEQTVVELIEKLNTDPKTDGLIVQLPLPKHLDEIKITHLVAPQKDVDGFTPLSKHTPCTALACLELIKSTGTKLIGKHAVVVGRSNIVGKPTAMLLLENDCTVTITHSHTVDLAQYTRMADILVVAVGKKNLITANMVKQNAIVIDVGINRDGSSMCGDVDFENVKNIADHITPVPGGVGPMTRVMLLRNVLNATPTAP